MLSFAVFFSFLGLMDSNALVLKRVRFQRRLLYFEDRIPHDRRINKTPLSWPTRPVLLRRIRRDLAFPTVILFSFYFFFSATITYQSLPTKQYEIRLKIIPRQVHYHEWRCPRWRWIIKMCLFRPPPSPPLYERHAERLLSRAVTADGVKFTPTVNSFYGANLRLSHKNGHRHDIIL